MDEDTRFHITPYLRRQMNDHPPRLAFSATSREEWRVWQHELRTKLRELLAPWPQSTDLAPETVQVSDEGDHRREEIVLSSHTNMEMPCFLLRPKDDGYPRPAILALHGHGNGKSEIVGLVESETNLSCSLGEYRGHGVELDELCGAQVVPGIFQWAEMGDVAGLLAPRPLFAENARHDECFPWPYTEPTLERLREVYRVAGAEEHLVIYNYDGTHHYYGDGVVEFWKRYL